MIWKKIFEWAGLLAALMLVVAAVAKIFWPERYGSFNALYIVGALIMVAAFFNLRKSRTFYEKYTHRDEKEDIDGSR